MMGAMNSNPLDPDPMAAHKVVVARQVWDRKGKQLVVGAKIELRTAVYRQRADGSFLRMGSARLGKAATKAAKRARQQVRRLAVT